MLVDELREHFKSIAPDIEAITAFWNNAQYEDRYARLHELSNQEDFWKHSDQINISREYQHLKELREQYHTIVSAYADYQDLIELFAQDEQELKKASHDIHALTKQIKKFKIKLLLSDSEDNKNCFFSINSGAGGTESQDWANMLLRMYLRFCEREGLSADIVDYQSGEEAGIKSATLYLKGTNAHGLLKTEEGIHRLVRISPFDSSSRRHTSFAAVTVTPEIEEAKIDINPDDLRIDTYRAGGKGGQHVNKTDSAVRITHLPTGVVVQCQSERSQLQNKQTAMKMLSARLAEKQKQEQETKDAAKEKKKIEWGSQIRSYVLHPYKMVKDHRTGIESPQPDIVLDGDLMDFIEGYLISQADAS